VNSVENHYRRDAERAEGAQRIETRYYPQPTAHTSLPSKNPNAESF
jgi:hypothetical protein